MNKKIISLAFLAAISTGTWAHDDRTPHYLVYEIPAPDLADPACVPGYATTAWLGDINNRRFAAGSATCYHDFGSTPEGRQNFATVSKPIAWSPLTSSYLLPFESGALALTVDDFNNAYGFQTSNALDGVKWTPGGGLPMLMYPIDPACGWGISIAVAANARGEVAGWAVRSAADDPFGCSIRTVIRKPGGEEVLGPLGTSPSTITNSGIVGFSIGNHAAKWNFRTGQIVPLRPETDPEITGVRGMTEREVTVGNSLVYESLPPAAQCMKSKVLLWDARNRERALPHPAGAVTSWPNDINEDEVIVGYSSNDTCTHPGAQNERAAIWVNGRATDLNRQLVGRPGVVLNSAIAINDRGEIVATGYRAWEPKKPCPQLVVPETGEVPYSDDTVCRDSHAYLLIPID